MEAFNQWASVVATGIVGIVTWVTKETVSHGKQLSMLVARLDASDEHAKERHNEIRSDLSELRSELRRQTFASSRGFRAPRPTGTSEGSAP